MEEEVKELQDFYIDVSYFSDESNGSARKRPKTRSSTQNGDLSDSTTPKRRKRRKMNEVEFIPKKKLDTVTVGGVTYNIGDCVYVEPDTEYVPSVNKIKHEWTDHDSYETFITLHSVTNYSFRSMMWICKITDLFVSTRNEQVFTGCWYYRPKDTILRSRKGFSVQEVFASNQKADNLVDLLRGKCEVCYYGDIEDMKLFELLKDHYFYKKLYDPDTFSWVDPFPNKDFKFEGPIKGLEMFCGCGGLSEGLSVAVDPMWAVDMNEDATDTFRQRHPYCNVFTTKAEDWLQTVQWIYGQTLDNDEDFYDVYGEQTEYNVDGILDCRGEGDSMEYLVQWEGYTEEQNEWVPKSELNCPELLALFHKRNEPVYTVDIQKSEELPNNQDEEEEAEEEEEEEEEEEMINEESDNEEDNERAVKIEKVIKRREKNNKLEYYVKWSGRPAEENTWISTDHPLLTKELIDELEAEVATGIYEVEKIKDVRIVNGKVYCLVRWKGYTKEDDTWEEEANLQSCADLIEQFKKKLRAKKIYPAPGDVHHISGGPPCQGFSSANVKRQDINPLLDERNSLVKVYLDVFRYFQPNWFLLENVDGLLQVYDAAALRMICKIMLVLNYQVRFAIINASWFGVPQSRQRIFVYAAKSGIPLPEFPKPTHIGVRGKAINPAFKACFILPESTIGLLPKITVQHAIGDLPPIPNGNWKDPEALKGLDYLREPFHPFQELMRANNTSNKVYSHINPTCGPAYTCPQPLEPNIPKKGSVEDIPLPKHYKLEKSNNRLAWAKSFNTICTMPYYNRKACAFHPSQPRLLSVREHARAQTFPDDFKFCGNCKSQIGNAVPPLLAQKIAKCLLQAIGRMPKPEDFPVSITLENLQNS